ncbi:MAG: hypothetical protein ACI3ZN_04070 [Candidatus Cryptobacteroides sp.]
MKQIALKVLFVLFGMFIGMEAFAQFYDDDKVYFYIEKENPEGKVYIVNFDGKEINLNWDDYSKVRRTLKRDFNYYEKGILDLPFHSYYDSKRSNALSIVYFYPGSMYNNYFKGARMEQHIDLYIFSKDRKNIRIENWYLIQSGESRGSYEFSSVHFNGILVDKSYFLKGSKYNVENNGGTIYE